MKKVKFIIEKGQLDSNGDMLKIDGLKIPDRTLLTRDFDNCNPIGYCDIFKEEGLLKAEADVPEEMLNAYPAIDFQVISQEINENNNRVINEAKLYSVSLCGHPNADPSIKRISEQ